MDASKLLRRQILQWHGIDVTIKVIASAAGRLDGEAKHADELKLHIVVEEEKYL